MDFILSMFRFGLDVLKILFGITLLFWMLFPGRKTISNLLKTIELAIKALCIKIRNKLIESLEKEKAEPKKDDEEAEYTVEASIR